jgi:hypothetical protein
VSIFILTSGDVFDSLGISACRANPALSNAWAVSAYAFALSEFVAFDQENRGGLIPKGVLFVLIVSGMYPILANEDVRHWRIKVLNETLPRQDKP